MNVRQAARMVGSGSSNDTAHKCHSTADFGNLMKGILDTTEAEAIGWSKLVFDIHVGGSNECLRAPHASPHKKRRMFS